MKIKIFYLTLAFLVISGFAAAAPDPFMEGKTIFSTRCASCHNVNKVLTGPALAGVDDRRSIDWIVKFIRSSQTMVKQGDKDAVALYEQFNKMPMPDHTDLSEESIKSIVAYIKSEAKSAGDQKAPFATPTVKRPAYLPVSFTRDRWPLLGLGGAVVLLIGSMVFAVKVNRMKDRIV